MKRRVVVTGIGPVTALGIGKDQFFDSIMSMRTRISEIPAVFERKYKFKSRHFVPKPDFSLSDIGLNKSVEAVMEEISRLAVMSAYLALEDAGFTIRENAKGGKGYQVEGLNNCSAIIGVGMSSLQTAFDSYVAHLSTDAELEVKELKPRFNRMVIPMLMTNSASAWLSILFGITGLNYTLNASCASGSMAIGEAYRNILNGRCDLALAGGVEALAEKNGATMRGFDMLTTLTRATDGRPRPFSENRSGFLFNEGAGCILVLEELKSAINRGADIYAEVAGYEGSSDAYNIVQMEPSGEMISSLYKKLTSGIRVDYLNAHGTGTVPNDEIEARIIQNVFGDQESQPLINSTKGILGHSIGASGALEAAVTALSIKRSRIHGNITADRIDNLNLPLAAMEVEINYALSASYGFGGHNALLLFKRLAENE